MNAATAPLAPPAPVLGQDQQPTGLNVRRLIWIRMIAVPGSAATCP